MRLASYPAGAVQTQVQQESQEGRMSWGAAQKASGRRRAPALCTTACPNGQLQQLIRC